MEIKVVYHNKELLPLEFIENKSDWIDLRCAEKVVLKKGEYRLISLGISVELPKGYEAHIVPRSSTFKNYGILQTNSMGVVDESYSGNNDIWRMPVLATRDTVIGFNERICQFRIMKKMERIDIVTIEALSSENRGGFGSTGKI
ncbi:MAG: deoxyuridine 5'-triphosphate nucleotidohydrolase [Clostridia bacterium]|nr:deoxyuridine 5'-triphosphate nucleotidohydrolase [Clostridia bacterium]